MFVRAGKVGLVLSLGLVSAGLAAPDPLATISHDASGVFFSADGPRLLLSEDEYGVQSTRTLGVGDEYRDGWIVRSLDANAITLAKDTQTRRIVMLGARAPVAAPAPIPAAPATVTAAFGVSNSGLNAAGKQAAIEDAINKGDPARVKALGGTSGEVAQATFQQMGRTAQELVKPGTRVGADGNARRVINQPGPAR